MLFQQHASPKKEPMVRIKKIIGVWFILIITACQALPTPAPLATATITAGPSPTPTFTPPAPPWPTPVPLVRIDAGDTALFNGVYALAPDQSQSPFHDTAGSAVRTPGLCG